MNNQTPGRGSTSDYIGAAVFLGMILILIIVAFAS